MQWLKVCLCAHLLLLFRRAAQQHVQQDVRQQVDGDLVVVLDDETAAGEDFTGQLVSHLKHNQCDSKTSDIERKIE